MLVPLVCRFPFGGRKYSTSTTKPLHLMLIGPPGGGKGTQCEKIKRDFGVIQISTGDLLREQIKLGTDLGKRVQSVMKSGGLVDDQTVLSLVEGVLTKKATIEKINGPVLAIAAGSAGDVKLSGKDLLSSLYEKKVRVWKNLCGSSC